MSGTLTIRLSTEDRACLEADARGRGKGVSALVRELAEAEARRIRRERIRADGQQVMQHLAHHAGARAELDQVGTPMTDLP